MAEPLLIRFSTAALAEGWLNLTVAAEPMLKLDQSSAMRADVWSITRVLPLGALIVPVPPAMLPPVGSWVLGTVCALACTLRVSAAASASASASGERCSDDGQRRDAAVAAVWLACMRRSLRK